MQAAQDLGLFRQTVSTCASQPWIRFQDVPSDENDGGTPHKLWTLYVEEESTKLSKYALLFLDFHMSTPCNARLLTSSLDLDWELPFSIALWEADTAESWSESLNQEPRIQVLLRPDAEPPCPDTRSLALATQSLMSGSPSPQLMVALAMSPMATLFVLTNIDAFVRDFTRCYCQMPPWATIASYRIVLAIWRSLRWAASEMRTRSAAESQGQFRRRFEAPTVIFHAIMDVAMEKTSLPGQNAGQEGLDAMMAASPELGEAYYAKAVLGFWKKRSVWPIGSSMATVLEEIVSDEYPDLVDSGSVAAWWSGPATGLG